MSNIKFKMKYNYNDVIMYKHEGDIHIETINRYDYNVFNKTGYYYNYDGTKIEDDISLYTDEECKKQCNVVPKYNIGNVVVYKHDTGFDVPGLYRIIYIQSITITSHGVVYYNDIFCEDNVSDDVIVEHDDVIINKKYEYYTLEIKITNAIDDTQSITINDILPDFDADFKCNSVEQAWHLCVSYASQIVYNNDELRTYGIRQIDTRYYYNNSSIELLLHDDYSIGIHGGIEIPRYRIVIKIIKHS